MTNSFAQFISKLLTSVFGGAFLPTALKSGFKGEKNTTPADFTPILRFVACSDIHLNGELTQENAACLINLIKDMNDYSANSAYKRLDAIMVAGDFTGGGAEAEYEVFNKIIAENKNPDTQSLTVLGNHEFINYRDVDATVGYTVYKKHINESVNTDTVINGYHFIGVSYDDNGKTFTKQIDWLNERLDAATKENSEKPVFVFQHPHPTLTVYGSGNWGDIAIRKALNKYPQVVDFSGHSHYCPADPRSVWQGEFTAVGCGSLKALMGNLNYIDGDKDAPGESGSAWVVEVDAQGNVSMKLYDVVNRIFFGSVDYYFTNLSKATKRQYNWHKQKSLDTKPLFPADASVSVLKGNEGEAVISFPEAKGYYHAENYKITVKGTDNKKAYENTVISEYVRATDNDVRVNVGNLKAGEYTVKLTAYSPYAKKGASLNNKITIK